MPHDAAGRQAQNLHIERLAAKLEIHQLKIRRPLRVAVIDGRTLERSLCVSNARQNL
jgi:hypothetical protein